MIIIPPASLDLMCDSAVVLSWIPPFRYQDPVSSAQVARTLGLMTCSADAHKRVLVQEVLISERPWKVNAACRSIVSLL